MTSAIGHFSLALAVLLALGALLSAVASIRLRSESAAKVANNCLWLFTAAVTLTIVTLLIALIRSDFRFEYVASYTERALPFGYKLAALWAGQEGSLLLWTWVLAILCSLALFTFRQRRGIAHAGAIGTMAVVCGFFAALMLFAANPFELIQGTVPGNGRGLNPMLQNPGMIIHPPLLFIGYAGFTIPFAVMVGVLIAGRRDNHWIADIRRWLIVAWLFLGAGIIVGAWWAYVELGWGGYWAWDPVENASLLPWLTATAVLHAMMVHQHRGMFKIWNVSLIAATFTLCIFGTYLTRSGVIDSVHAFAESMIGTFFLVFLIVCVIVSVALIVWRRRALKAEHEMEGIISREGAFLISNVLLTIMTVTVLVGTIFPIFSGLFVEEPISVGPPFYNRIVLPMAIALVALMAIGPVLAFGREAAAKIARALRLPAIAALLVTAGVAVMGAREPWILICVAITALGTFAVIVSFVRSVSARRRNTDENIFTAAVRLIDRDHRRYGGQLAHLGVMLIVIGVAGSSLFSIEKTASLSPNESVTVGRYEVTFISLDEVRHANFTAVDATVELALPNGNVKTLHPQRRFYDTWKDEPNSEVAIRSTWRDDVYLTLAGWEAGGKTTALQIRVNPLVMWIWIGGIVMGLGGLFSIVPRVLRKTRRAPATKPAAVHQPTTRPAPEPALQTNRNASLETSA